MANPFNKDFQDFIEALNKHNVEYILVGGYAVILHGYIRSTADMDIWVNKTEENYIQLTKAFATFNMPVFDMSLKAFLGNKFDVWSFGIEPNRIDIITNLKGVVFKEAFQNAKIFNIESCPVRYIHLNHLIQAKEAAGRYKDKDDIEQLRNNNKNE